jgi:predicted nucleotidyltransferase
MTFKPEFPTPLHRDAAEMVRDHFFNDTRVDTVLLLNSCARGQGVPESDLDMAILAKPHISPMELREMEAGWQTFCQTQATLLEFRRSGPFAHLHVDIITGDYRPGVLGMGEPIDYFEIEIGNHICYSAPMDGAGPLLLALREKWLPYYQEELRLQRFSQSRRACVYDLDHIPIFIRRGLYFQAFDILVKAFQEYLQTLFIANRVYPIAYNKWIKEQVAQWLGLPGLYQKLPQVLSVVNLESDEINEKARLLRELLDELAPGSITAEANVAGV